MKHLRPLVVRGSAPSCGWFALAAAVFLLLTPAGPAMAASGPARLTTRFLDISLAPETGAYEIVARDTGTRWRSNERVARFGEATLRVDGKPRTVSLGECIVSSTPRALLAQFHPVAERAEAWLYVRIRALADDRTLEFAYETAAGVQVESLRLLDEALSMTDTDAGCALVPVREGLLVPADSGRFFTNRFDTYAYEGCHMAMLGLVKRGAAALVTWDDPYVAVELRSAGPARATDIFRQRLATSLVLRQSARACRVQFLGPGDYVTVAQAYRADAQARGWRVPWRDKLAGHPDRARLFGAANVKLWSALDRRMNEESTREEAATVNWTFDEAAQVAEHLQRDLKLDKVLFTVGGWIRRGYDNQHPDILPAAPECGGDAKLAECARRVQALGYLFCLHDNYQDIYRDAPSWDESYIMRGADGRLAVGGHWAGGRAYLTCARRAVDLARRPQNLAAVRQLTGARSYFIDTTYAAGLQECFDPKHPLTRGDDLHWKQELSDYARAVFGVFGSECGREWAIPHSDFFEGLTGVSGTHFHDAELTRRLGAVVVPLFELVYHDTIAMYGKYGYEEAQAAEYVLQHMIYGRPLNYHSVPPHLYWRQSAAETDAVQARVTLAEVRPTQPGQFAVRYRWQVERKPATNWQAFVHFCDAAGKIRFQADYAPGQPVSQWSVGERMEGPFDVTVPADAEGVFEVRAGLFNPADNRRARLLGRRQRERAYLLGRVEVRAGRVKWLEGSEGGAAGDPGLFLRADNGWTEGLHPADRFLKNTQEILGPLNELTAQMPMESHAFLTADRRVQRSVFGQGGDAVTVTVNFGGDDYAFRSARGGPVVLPPYGFLVEAPAFVAFHARGWNGLVNDGPVCFAMRSLDGRPLSTSSRVKVYHGFGDDRLHWRHGLVRVANQCMLTTAEPRPVGAHAEPLVHP